MTSSFRLAAIVGLVAASSAAGQDPARTRTAAPPAAELLLANVGTLQLTDAQVVRLAAIARRSQARRSALSSAFDSARSRFAQPGDSVARRQFRDRMRADLDRALEQGRTEQRDALAVLNADQQAKAWSLVASRGRGMRGGMPGMRSRGQRPMMERRLREGRRDRMSERMGDRMRDPSRRMRAPRPARPPLEL